MAEPSLLQKLKNLFGTEDLSTPSAPERIANAAPAPVASPPELDLTRIPDSAKDRVAAIRALIGDLESRAAVCSPTGFEPAELMQIGTVYLPRLLQSYAEIPPGHRSEIFRDTGRSASFLLVERLDKIIDRLNEISKDMARGHIDAFSDNMRFIDLRYGPANPFE